MKIFYTVLLLGISYAIVHARANNTPYQGRLTTLDNEQYAITNLCMGNKRTCMDVYDPPKDTTAIIPLVHYNPKNFTHHIKLADIKEITSQYPYTTWAEATNKKHKYTLIEISWNDSTKANTLYLIEARRRISCTMLKKTGASLHKIPVSGIKKVTITSNASQKT